MGAAGLYSFTRGGLQLTDVSVYLHNTIPRGGCQLFGRPA
jgi:hypothetical protein